VKSGFANETAVQVVLLRATGKPTLGSLVTLSADTVGGRGGSFGQFTPTSVLATTDKVSVRFTPGTTAYRGQVIVRATATLAGESVTDSTTVVVTDP
jgi:hypothetical protein